MTNKKIDPPKLIKEIIGWYGALAILTAFAGISFGVLTPVTPLYHILNGTGALSLAFISLKKRAYQPALINLIWSLIAVTAFLRFLFESNSR